MFTLARPSRKQSPRFIVLTASGILCLAASCIQAPAANGAPPRPAETSAPLPVATTPASPAAARPASNAGQRAAAERMLTAAEQALAGLHDLEGIRPRAWEFMAETLTWHRRRLEAQLLLYPEGPQRAAALGEYLTTTRQYAADQQARRNINATPNAVNLAAYAEAEAEYLAASDGALPAAQTPEQQAAAQRMIDAATLVVQDILDLEHSRPRTPEFLQLRLEALRRQLDANLLLNPAGPQRQAFVEGYLAQARQCASDVNARKNLDATPATIAQTEYAVADAELLAAGPAAPPDVVARLQAAAKQVYDGLLRIAPIQPRTPESLALRLEWMKKLMAADLLAHPRPADQRPFLEQYAAEARQSALDIKRRVSIDATRAHVAMTEYAVAQADYFLAGSAVP